MPKKLPKNKNTWVSLAREFVKEWPEVLSGLHFSHMPVKYLKHINIILKNNLSLNYNIKKEMKTKSQDHIAKFLRDLIENNYFFRGRKNKKCFFEKKRNGNRLEYV